MSKRDQEIVEAFRRQSTFCSSRNAEFTAAIITACADEIEARGALYDVVKDFVGDPDKGALALRIAGALHWLHLSGRVEDDLAQLYERTPRDADLAMLRPAISKVVVLEREMFDYFVSNTPQTNEVKRAAALLLGFSKIFEQTQKPLELFELGASGGLLLAWDQFRFDFGAFEWGEKGPVITAEWRGSPPDLAPTIPVAGRRGCDLNPMNLEDAEQLLIANSYIWPEDRARRALFNEAVKQAAAAPIAIEQANAVDWLKNAAPSPKPGVTTVVYHSVFGVYLNRSERAQLDNVFATLADLATKEAPVARLSFEMEETDQGLQFFLDLEMWPNVGKRGEKTRLARAHHHGAWVEPLHGSA